MSTCRPGRTAATLVVLTTGALLTSSVLPAQAEAATLTSDRTVVSSFIGPTVTATPTRLRSARLATPGRPRLFRSGTATSGTRGLAPAVAPRTTTVVPAPVVGPVAPVVTASTPAPAVTAPVVPAPATAPAAAPVEAPIASAPAAPVRASRPTLGTVAFSGQGGRLAHASAYSVVELNAWEADTARALKAANPALKVLVYKDMTSTRSYAVTNGKDDALLPTGVGYVAAQANPAWFLKDTTGARMEWPWGGHWWMDVADKGYQAAWTANVQRELAAGPWDGVVIDNVMASPEWYLEGRTIAAYPTKAAYAAATESFLTAVAPALKATGKMVLGNISDASPSTWDRWVQLMDGGNHEHSFLWNNGARYGGGDWISRVEEIERTARAGRVHTATSSYAKADKSTATWVRASWLMAWDGGTSGSLQFVDSKDGEEAYDATVATDLGAPAGPRTAVGGAWKRDFAGGTAVVNPSTSPVTVALGRSLTTLDGATVTSVTLAPLTGALLKG